MPSRTRVVAATLALGLGLAGPARAAVYAYTADDGSVSLSNVPTDDRYTILIPAANEGAPPAAAPAAIPDAAALLAKAGYAGLIDQVSRAYGVESALLHAVVFVESRYNPNAVSKKGAAGLMQLMPDTARRYGVGDVFDPLQNLGGGARYLRDLLRLFDNDVALALAAYNAGEQAVMKHGKRIPPYRETQRYVPQVLQFYRRHRTDS
jgi:soluble lytic murein transglycosylase-like protein